MQRREQDKNATKPQTEEQVCNSTSLIFFTSLSG
jgi:hypothetical protein